VNPDAVGKQDRPSRVACSDFLGGVMLISIYNSVKILNINLINNCTQQRKILGSMR
jgi:hypothetical protein